MLEEPHSKRTSNKNTQTGYGVLFHESLDKGNDLDLKQNLFYIKVHLKIG